jgi:hypothetical protein
MYSKYKRRIHFLFQQSTNKNVTNKIVSWSGIKNNDALLSRISYIPHHKPCT